MPEFKQTKQMVFTATRVIQAADGLEAARKLAEWMPTLWHSSEGDSSSEPWHVPKPGGWTEDRPMYEVRACRGHFHVTNCGEDIVLPGDPFATRESAERAAIDAARAQEER